MVGLVTSAYTPAQDTDQYWVTPQANEITGTGYTAGGAQLTGTSVGSVVSAHIIPLLANPSVWSGATFTTRYAIVYKKLSTAATSPLIGWVDFGVNEVVTGGTFQLTWDSTFGVLRATAN